MLSGQPHFKMRPAGFESLAKIIIEQQVSTASAWAVWARIENEVKPLTPETVLMCSDEMLRGLGLSRQKSRYLRALSESVLNGHLNLTALPRMSDDAVMGALQSVTGIGRWTSEIYLLFCLGRPDVWPASDIALQAAWQDVRGLKARPSVDEMDHLAETWRPLRGVAALILWEYYRHIKGGPAWE